MLSIFSCVWPPACLLWKNVYLDLPVFLLSFVCFVVILAYMSCLYILENNALISNEVCETVQEAVTKIISK